MQPQTLTDFDVAFGSVRGLMPRYEDIPQEFKRDSNPYVKLVSRWFFNGLNKSALKVKEGVDERAALRHLKAVLGSFDPSHEHKTAAVAYLMSLWFDVTGK